MHLETVFTTLTVTSRVGEERCDFVSRFEPIDFDQIVHANEALDQGILLFGRMA